MKKFAKRMVGVTLLEIMLVLAIAAMIIVMSVRYYQSANQNSQANTFVEQVGAVSAGVENLVQGTGNYSTVSTAQLTSILPANTLTTAPWGGGLTFTATSTGYTLKAGTAASGTTTTGLCGLIFNKLTA